MTTAMDDHIGRRLRQLRDSLGFTQQDLGAAIGVGFRQIQKYESGLCPMSAARLWQCARTLGATVDCFFEGFAERQRG